MDEFRIGIRRACRSLLIPPCTYRAPGFSAFCALSYTCRAPAAEGGATASASPTGWILLRQEDAASGPKEKPGKGGLGFRRVASGLSGPPKRQQQQQQQQQRALFFC